MSVEFLSLTEGRLAYQRQVGREGKPGILFLGGFGSDMTGTKAGFLAQYCFDHALSFVRFDYRGSGQSTGKFTDATIGAWFDDSLAVFDHLTNGLQIVVGSSMGGWLGLLLANARTERVKALIGIAAAPDFTEELVWNKLTKSQRQRLELEGQIYEDNAPPDHRLPITLNLIEEARRHLVFRTPFQLACPLRLLQGSNDEEVPPSYANRIASHVTQDDKRVILVENGDHRLKRPEDLALLAKVIAEFT